MVTAAPRRNAAAGERRGVVPDRASRTAVRRVDPGAAEDDRVFHLIGIASAASIGCPASNCRAAAEISSPYPHITCSQHYTPFRGISVS